MENFLRFDLVLALTVVPAAWATVFEQQAAPPDARAPSLGLAQTAGIIEFPRRTLIFKPTRDDMRVGRVVLSVYCSKSAEPSW